MSRGVWSRWGSYENFMKSPEWEVCRTLAFGRDGGECRRCGCQEWLEGHHENYSDPDNPDTVVTACHWCHQEYHELERRREARRQSPSAGRVGCKHCSGRYRCEAHGG